MKKLFVNLLVFVQDVEIPVNQAVLIKQLQDKGLNNIEIRYEFLEHKQDIEDIRELVDTTDVNLYLSIPDTLYDNGIIDRYKIDKYIEVANKLGVRSLKFSVGDFYKINDEDVDYLNEIASKFKLYVENDQSYKNGNLVKLVSILEMAKAKNVNIKATFDIGNWLWVDQDPKQASDKLKPYVDYVHFKDVKIEDGVQKATLLGDGVIDYKYFLELFKDVDCAIEYPCGKNPMDTIVNELEKIK